MVHKNSRATLGEHGLDVGTWCAVARPRGQSRYLSSTWLLERLMETGVLFERDCKARFVTIL